MAKSKFDKLRKADRSPQGRLMPLYVGVATALIGGWGYFHWRAMGSWPGVPAQVLSASVEQVDASAWQPAVEYQYTVDGVLFKSSHVAPFGFPVRSRAVVERLVAQFQQAVDMVAYVNPRNPKKSYLIPNTEATAERFYLGLLGLGLGAFFIGALFLMKQKRKRRTA